MSGWIYDPSGFVFMTPELEKLLTLRGILPSEIQLCRKLASGGLSDLWVARHDSVFTPFVVKYARDSAENNSYMFGQFEREYQASQAMMAKGIEYVTTVVFDFDVDALGHPYTFAEYFPAHSLETLRKSITAWDDVRNIFRQLEKYLSIVHASGIIHRDIKPANIIMNERGEIRIIDFALSTIDGEWHRYHEEGMALGTPLYMSPEQAYGKKNLLTPACDWYSTGVMLFEWMTGRLPFIGVNSNDTMKMHCFCQPPAPENKNIQNAPDSLSDICLGLLAKNPEVRMSSVLNFRRLLNA